MTATDRQKEIHALYRQLNCNSSAVAKQTGLTVTAVNKHLFYAARNGLDVTLYNYSEVAPAGWSSYARSVLHKDGDIKLVWDKIRPDELNLQQFWKFLEDRTPTLKTIFPCPNDYDENLCLEWKLMDHHLGMHSWAKETGSNYGIKEAQFLIESAASKIFEKISGVQKAIIVLGGDNMHADNRSAQTERSKFHLDVDNRYEKSVDGIYSSMVTAIDISLTKSKEVEIIVLSGNHDYHSAINLSRILKAHYRNEPRINVNTSPGKHKFSRWGNNYFMYSHGDTASANRLSAFLLNHIIDNEIHGIKRKLVRKGHVHKSGKVFPPGLVEEDGVIIETFPTLAAPDSYSAESAFVGSRVTVAEIWHKKYGQRSRMELGVDELMDTN